MNVRYIFTVLTFLSVMMRVSRADGDVDLTSLNNRVFFLEKNLSSLETRADNLVKTWDGASELSFVKSQLQIVQHDLRNKASGIQSIKDELNILKTNIKPANPSINVTILDTISSDVKTNIREIHALRAIINSTDKDVSDVKTDVGHIRQKLTNLTENCQTNKLLLETEVENISRWRNKSRAKIEGFKAEINRVLVMQNASDGTIKSLEANFQTLQDNINAFMSNISSNDRELPALRTNVVDTEQEANEIKLNVSLLEMELMNMSKRYAAYKRSLEFELQTMTLWQNESRVHLDDIQAVLEEISEKQNSSEQSVRLLEEKLESKVSLLQNINFEFINDSTCHPKTSVRYQALMNNPERSIYDHSLRFDIVLVNDGKGYDKRTFTAPIAGTYLLWANVVHDSSDRDMDIALCRQRKGTVAGPSGPGTTCRYGHSERVASGKSSSGQSGYDTAFIMVLVDLNVGDQLWYEVIQLTRNIFGYRYSGSGGILLSTC